MSGPASAFELRELNRRIRDRFAAADRAPRVPGVRGPSWSAFVVDTGAELLAVHGVTGAAFPLDPQRDLALGELAIVLARRILAAGASVAEARRLLGAMALETHASARLFRQLEGAAP